jgi:hypothetical protein
VVTKEAIVVKVRLSGRRKKIFKVFIRFFWVVIIDLQAQFGIVPGVFSFVAISEALYDIFDRLWLQVTPQQI